MPLRRPSRRTRKRKHHRHAPGTAPGTLVVDPEASRSKLRMIAYGPDGFEERADAATQGIPELQRKWPVLWVHVEGLGDEGVLRRLGELFGLHRLALEDVVQTGQRPKSEPYPEYLFVVARPVSTEADGETDQLSLFLGDGFVLTFQERTEDAFDRVRERIRQGGGLIRAGGAGYLSYALLDAVIDAYFPALEAIGDELDRLEDEVLEDPDQATVSRLHELKRRLVHLRRNLGPHRDMLATLARDAGPRVSEETAVYLRDAYDHSVRLTELAETYRELAADLMATSLSWQSHRMNEVMKVLTVIATLFIPLSFIAGLYGMNFDPAVSPWNMPELDWYWGYPFALGLMGAVALGLVAYFWRKGWMR